MITTRRAALAAALLLASAGCGGGGTTAGHAVAGTVSGLRGAGLVLHLGPSAQGQDLAVAADGPFRFPGAVEAGAAWELTVKTPPSSPSQTCRATPSSGVMGAVDAAVTVTCTTDAFHLGGTLSGLAGGSLTLRDGAGQELVLSADGPWRFDAPVASGAAFAVTVAVQPTGPSQTCAVAGGSGTVGAGDVTSVAVTCELNDRPVSGTVVGLRGAGLVLQVNGAFDTAVSADSFAVLTNLAEGDAYAVTVLAQPTAPWQTCQVTAGCSGVMGAAGASGLVVTCTTRSFQVGGAVAGLLQPGLSLELRAAGQVVATPALDADGSWSFPAPLASGRAYLVTVAAQPATQDCLVTGGDGVVAGGDVTVEVACGCRAGLAHCGGPAGQGCETSLLTDAAHCGGCATPCLYSRGAGGCSGGTCFLAACDQGYSDCDGRAPNGCEVSIDTSPLNCGGCGQVCGGAQVATSGCTDRTCTVLACNAGFGDCDGGAANGCETNTQTSAANCGSCGFACQAGEGCAAGACVAQPSCLELLLAGAAADGVYTINPTQLPGGDRQVYCDMTTDGGGWTFFAHVNADYLAGRLFEADLGTYDPSRADGNDSYGLGGSIYAHLGASRLMVTVNNKDPLAASALLLFLQFAPGAPAFSTGPVPCTPSTFGWRTLQAGSFSTGIMAVCDDTDWQTWTAIPDPFGGGLLQDQPLLGLRGGTGLGTLVGSGLDPSVPAGTLGSSPHDSWWYAR